CIHGCNSCSYSSILYIVFHYILYTYILFFFFFFQAEDGIRDPLVTGVQTCALPICVVSLDHERQHRRSGSPQEKTSAYGCIPERSEERRVGKECRSRWSA